MNHGTAALARGLAVLEALADVEDERDDPGVVELTEIVGGDKSQLSRALATLEEGGWVERDRETLGYRLGWRVYGVAARAGDRRLLEAARPVLRDLVAEFGESVHLSVRENDMVLTLLSESPPATLHAPARVGGLTPIATTSAGRVLVSELDGTELRVLGLGDRAAAVAEAGRRGYAIVREEFEPGLVAAAAPIRDASGAIVAALNVSAPRFRFDGRLEAAAARLVVAAAEVSRAIGG